MGICACHCLQSCQVEFTLAMVSCLQNPTAPIYALTYHVYLGLEFFPLSMGTYSHRTGPCLMPITVLTILFYLFVFLFHGGQWPSGFFCCCFFIPSLLCQLWTSKPEISRSQEGIQFLVNRVFWLFPHIQKFLFRKKKIR